MTDMPPVLLVDLEPDKESTTAPLTPGSPADVLARTLYGEARGEPVRGQEAIAAVVLNRVARAQRAGGKYWWGSSIAEVCRKPSQFSCWNAADPNRAVIEAVTMETRAFRVCARIALRAVAGVLGDPTKGATHYHTISCAPPWARGRTPSAQIGSHLFYTNVE
jgi:spore germination cell wall hydrolase CwlJ-like protein